MTEVTRWLYGRLKLIYESKNRFYKCVLRKGRIIYKAILKRN